MFIGLCGKPSAGKSTFFKASTLMDVATANYPFTTIKPNEGVTHIRVERIDKFFNVESTPRVGFKKGNYRFVPVKLLDVAGLVPGAHEGKGMGNQFLDDLRQADVLIHVIDVSGSLNENGEPIEVGSYDPIKDAKFLENELDMWYYNIFQRVWPKFSNTVNQAKENVVKAIATQFSGLKVDEDMVKNKVHKLDLSDKIIIKWTDEDIKNLAIEFRKETKPIIIAANKVDMPGAHEKFEDLKKEFPNLLVIPCSAESELALKEADKHELIDYTPGENDFKMLQAEKLSDKQKKALEFIKVNILDKYGSTGVQQVLDYAVFNLLKYIALFPGGVGNLTDSEGRVIPDCFLLPPKTTALDFAFHLHTDLGTNFIRAINVKTKMGMKKDQELTHRDIIEIVHNK
ncbi:redox-regulated ATPase YchF [archaeon]|nr:redox-regulated ATPase YchF [archaeon]